jgi:beta-phosphoglucomutase-like phosphatase (HAD superfamily)
VDDAERIVREACGPDFPLEEHKKRHHALEAAFKAGPLPKKPGLDELLDLLDSWGIPRAVATSTRSEISLPELARTKLLPRFRRSQPATKLRRASLRPICFFSQLNGSALSRRGA